ncbi:TPA: DUF551 domain-containing protein [Proteus mirabilis]|uniref:DUF551 domain-containing protein n=2 Tax=Proteus mirabilis TaxID=584 RepID=UPI0029E64845|nr:DUF551 domain-containing protein [Proteus mirabilis]
MQGTNWVKSSDKMPPYKTPVLCCDINSLYGEVFIADYIREFRFGDRAKLTGFYRGNMQGNVTHWMSLPPMPEGE